jgi:hypothetical protein
MNAIHRSAIFLLTSALIASTIGCGSSSGVQTITPLGPTTPPTPAPQHLYLSQGSVYTLPISNPSVPTYTIGAAGLGMAFDSSHRLYVANPADGSVQVCAPPIRRGATPAFTLSTGLAGADDVAFDAAGDLLVAGHATFQFCFKICRLDPRDAIKVFAAPIASSSTPSASYAGSPFFSNLGSAIDQTGDLWVADGLRLSMYAPPFNGAAVNFAVGEPGSGIALDSTGDLYVCTPTGVDVFVPPFGPAMAKSFTISTPSAAHYLAFDAAGNLYVTTSTGTLIGYAKPLSAASTPFVTLNVPNFSIAPGIAIGP